MTQTTFSQLTLPEPDDLFSGKWWGVHMTYPSPPCVYLFWATNTPMFKIGYTSGPIENRFKSVQTMSPVPLQLVTAKSGSRTDEHALHMYFGEYRVNGEWFQITDTTAFKTLLQSYNGGHVNYKERLVNLGFIDCLLWFAAKELKERQNRDADSSEAG